jgi:hypothetical protein
MQFYVFRALWGMEGRIEEQVEQIAAAGYDGIDGFIGASTLTPSQFTELVKSHGLRLYMSAQVDTKEALEPTLKALAEYNPLKIGLHSGRDSMSRYDGYTFFEEALRLEQQVGIPVAHETHRGRMFYSPWDTASYLREFDTLKILADYSHWVNVCERLPDDQADALNVANARAIHIHGRVGYEQGPQVPDPSAPEYERHLLWHEAQWKQIITNRRKAGDPYVTFTPEYGPPDYLHTLPHTRVPVADLWRVCLWGMERARKVLAPIAEGVTA